MQQGICFDFKKCIWMSSPQKKSSHKKECLVDQIQKRLKFKRMVECDTKKENFVIKILVEPEKKIAVKVCVSCKQSTSCT